MSEAARGHRFRPRALAAILVFAPCVFLAGCGRAASSDDPRIARGKKFYEVSCGACHKPDGLGAEGVGPPMVGSPWVTGSEERLVRIALHGVRGPLDVGGTSYNLEMPGMYYVWNDQELAALLTYIRQAWSNGAAPIEPRTVAAIRRRTAERGDSWTVEELMEIR